MLVADFKKLCRFLSDTTSYVQYIALEDIDAINIGLAHFSTGHDRCDL